jgi:hypothetical protein
MIRAAVAMLGVLLALGGTARADGDTAKPSYRVVVDRIDHEPASIGGTRLQITMSALTLQGQLIDLTDPKTIKTYLNGTEIKAPYALGTFRGTDDAAAIVIVVESMIDYTEVMPAIAETLDGSLLAALDDKSTTVAILPYGEAVGTGRLTSVKTARGKATALASDGSTGDPALLETIERGLSLLKHAKTEPEGRPLRKMIIVISDGRDRANDPARVIQIGDRAAKESVRIHSFAFSPTDQRKPLLNLGELSKRSFGTFRWLQRDKADSWAPAFEQLRDEINRQYVLTYFVGADEDPGGKKLRIETVGRVVAKSNELKVPAATCNGEVCGGYCTGTVCAVPQVASGRGILGWVLLIGGIAIGGFIVLLALGFVLTKLGKGKSGPAVAPGLNPAAQAAAAAHIAAAQAAAAQQAAPAQQVISGPHLIFLNGPRTGERVALRNGFSIGKAPGNDMLIEDGFTSSQHAQIGMDHFGNCRLYDRGSTNGTFVNGVRVQEYVLEHGVSLRIGSTELRFLAQ